MPFKLGRGRPFTFLVTESITPRSVKSPEIRYQPSLLSVPSAANTVAPEPQASGAAPQPPQRPWRKLWFFAAVSSLVAVGGASALRSAAHVTSQVHSGSPGFKKSSTGRELVWQKRNVTVFLDGSLAKLGPTANDAVMQAFGEWVGRDSKLPALRFDSGGTSTAPKQDGKSTVSYAPITAPGHEHDVAITMTYSNDKTGEIIEADIVLNALYPMGVLTAKSKPAPPAALVATAPSGKTTHDDDEAEDCQSRYDAQNVVTHEAGHFFGLGEDMTERNATMFLSIDQCETHKRVLSSTDVGAVETLYQASQASADDDKGAAGCALGGAPSGGATLISGLVLGLSLLRRRPAR